MSDGLLRRYTKQLKAINVGGMTEVTEVDRTPPRRAHAPAHSRGLGMLILHLGKDSERAFELRSGRTTIGRGDESDIVLEDPAVSCVHAIVTRDEAGTYRIRDHDSVNGVYVNGQRITEHMLEDGEDIQVGMTWLAFRQ
jgi:hypothetical protein